MRKAIQPFDYESQSESVIERIEDSESAPFDGTIIIEADSQDDSNQIGKGEAESMPVSARNLSMAEGATA